jgi:hypothetical protein
VRSEVGVGNYAVVLTHRCMTIVFADTLMPRVTMRVEGWEKLAEVFESRDVDGDCVGYTGPLGTVFTSGRGALAWVHRLNTPTDTRSHNDLSPPYEERLWHRAKQFGFAVLDLNNVDCGARDAEIAQAYTHDEIDEDFEVHGLNWMVLAECGAIQPEEHSATIQFFLDAPNAGRGNSHRNVDVAATALVEYFQGRQHPVKLGEDEHEMDDYHPSCRRDIGRAARQVSLSVAACRSELELIIFSSLHTQIVPAPHHKSWKPYADKINTAKR